MIKQWLRYGVAVIISPLIGEIFGIPLAIVLDVLWGHEVTGGIWELTFPNLLLVVLKAAIVGFSAGWIAQRHGALVAIFANFFLLTAAIAISVSLNRDLLGGLHTATKPALWAWIGLMPAATAGYFTTRYRHLGLAPFLATFGVGMSIVLQIGALAFHLYTVIVAYLVNGFLGAFLVFVMPVLSEFWYAWHIWGLSNSFWNQYSLRFALLILWGICTIIVWTFAENIERKRSSIAATVSSNE